MYKKFLILLFIFIPLNSYSLEKQTTFDKDLFKQAQSDGKVVVVSSWIKYCYSCASQMKVLEKAKNCLLYTSPSPRDRQKSRMPSSA